MIEAAQVNNLYFCEIRQSTFILYLIIQQLATMTFQIEFASDPQPHDKKVTRVGENI